MKYFILMQLAIKSWFNCNLKQNGSIEKPYYAIKAYFVNFQHYTVFTEMGIYTEFCLNNDDLNNSKIFHIWLGNYKKAGRFCVKLS